MVKIREVVKIVLIDICDKHKGDLTFKAEISQYENQFFVDLYKKEVYSLSPTGESVDEIADEVIWVNYSQVLSDDEPSLSVKNCLDKVIKTLGSHYELEE